MCIIIDTNTFSSVFDKDSLQHKEFSPVLSWLIEGEGKIVFGGTKYIGELKLAKKYLRFIGQLNRARKVVQLENKPIDEYQSVLEAIEKHKDFDDPHLVAISYISKCRLICSLDKRAFPFLSRKDFYPNNSPRPSIYCSKKNSNLLCRRYFADICNPCIKLNKEAISILKK